MARLSWLCLSVIACGPSPRAPEHPGDAPAPWAATATQPTFPWVPPTDSGEAPFPSEPITSVPVYGGTLESVPAIGTFVAADPEGNVLLVWHFAPPLEVLELGDNARPFRIHVEDRRAWVTLRGTGELIEVDLDGIPAVVTSRIHVCAEPRGVARSPLGTLVVACAEGLVVEVDDEANVVRSQFVIEDLRDVVPVGDLLYVSRFASAEVVALDAASLTQVFRLPLLDEGSTAWRMRPDVYTGGVFVLHQRVSSQPVPLRLEVEDEVESAYGREGDDGFATPCHTLHTSMLSRLPAPAWPGHTPLPEPGVGLEDVVVGTDFAVSDDGRVAFASTGAEIDGPIVVAETDVRDLLENPVNCRTEFFTSVVATHEMGVPTAVGFMPDGDLLYQTAGPRHLIVNGVSLSVAYAQDTDASVQLFHRSIDAPVACVSCHPEGVEDGRVWLFDRELRGVVGPTREVRRTMPLAGSVLSRTPYHWAGDLSGPVELMHDTFTMRMGNGDIEVGAVTELFDWLDGLRRVRAVDVDPAVVVSGRRAFEKADCHTCHSGASYTNGAVETVRWAVEAVKTPSLLGVGIRQPLLHDGCAATLEARFLPPCDDGTDQHGLVSTLDPAELTALIAYLRTL